MDVEQFSHRDIASWTENDMQNLTMRDFGRLSEKRDFPILFNRMEELGIDTIAGYSIWDLVKLYSPLIERNSEDWQPDLCGVTIQELATEYGEETRICLLEL